MDATGGEVGDRGSLSSWQSDIVIPINFQEVSDIVTFWSFELHVPLEVWKGWEAPLSNEAET